MLKKNTKQSNTTRASELIQAITVKKNDVAKEIPSDNPFSPSIRLKACDTPDVANIVNKIANGENKKGDLRRLDQPLSTMYPVNK